MQAHEYQASIEGIRVEYAHGRITREEAQRQAAPLIRAMNERAAAIAKEHGMRHKPFTFAYLMR